MPRQRLIWPSIWDDPDLASISVGAHLLYIACFSLADDEGRLDGSPVFLASHAFAYRKITHQGVKRWRDECEKSCGNFLVYVVNRREYIAFTDWSEWQHPKYPSPSRIPPPQLSLDLDSGNDSPNGSGNDSPTRVVKSDSSKETPITPRRKNTNPRVKKTNPRATGTNPRTLGTNPRTDKLVFEALCEEQGINYKHVNDGERGKINKATKLIKESIRLKWECDKDEFKRLYAEREERVVQEIHTRAERYRAIMPGAMFTAKALADHWQECGKPDPVKEKEESQRQRGERLRQRMAERGVA